MGDSLQQLALGKISYSDLLNNLAPDGEHKTASVSPRQAHVLPPEVLDALNKIPAVYGSVVLDRFRALTPAELRSLLQERATLDRVEKQVKTRKDAIREVVLIHHDAVVEKEEDSDEYQRDLNGHFATKRYHEVDGEATCFEVRVTHKTNLSASGLKALADDVSVPGFTHDDYLAMTEQVRVVQSDLVMIHLRKNPELVPLLREAIDADPPQVSVYQSKVK